LLKKESEQLKAIRLIENRDTAIRKSEYSGETEYKTKENKKTPWPLVREGNIPTDRLPLVGEI
jgi:hypothetical protein